MTKLSSAEDWLRLNQYNCCTTNVTTPWEALASLGTFSTGEDYKSKYLDLQQRMNDLQAKYRALLKKYRAMAKLSCTSQKPNLF